MYYLEITLGSGFYWLNQYIMAIDCRTLDVGGAVDILCDYLEEHEDSHVINVDELEWDEDDNLVDKATKEIVYYSDEFVTGGNHGINICHYGDFAINEISLERYNSLARQAEVVVVQEDKDDI